MPKFAKGSQESKEHMAKLRAMRGGMLKSIPSLKDVERNITRSDSRINKFVKDNSSRVRPYHGDRPYNQEQLQADLAWEDNQLDEPLPQTVKVKPDRRRSVTSNHVLSTNGTISRLFTKPTAWESSHIVRIPDDEYDDVSSQSTAASRYAGKGIHHHHHHHHHHYV